MIHEYRVEDWGRYKMNHREPHRQLEPLEKEIAVVDGALGALKDAGVLPHTNYDRERFLAHRKAVAERFEIPWTAITPRLQRLIYAINAIRQPDRVLAAGVFCGNTFVCNVGAAVGPGGCYTARELVGVEIKPEEAERAERNVRKLDPSGVAKVIAADAVQVARDHDGPIDLLYLDATAPKEAGKGIYLAILEAALPHLRPGSLVLAHNSVDAAEKLAHYLAFVRDDKNMRTSVNAVVDGEGLEVSMR